MSGSDLAYKTRPNKHIDRELFITALDRVVPIKGAQKYVYMSMGGAHLVDHRIIYRRLGIENLFSFDNDKANIARQMFNRPLHSMACQELDSSAIAGNIENILGEFEGADNVIVWLDFTSPNERYHQLQQASDLADKLQPGDVLRITMNANPQTLFENRRNANEWKEAGAKSAGHYRAIRLKKEIEEFAPHSINFISEQGLPEAILACIDTALQSVLSLKGKNVDFVTLLNTTYKDGQRMVTCCVFVQEPGDKAPASIKTWEHFPSKPTDITHIEAPNLSLQEKLAIDNIINLPTTEIVDKLDFIADVAREKLIRQIDSYKRIHRYYPSFHSIEV